MMPAIRKVKLLLSMMILRSLWYWLVMMPYLAAELMLELAWGYLLGCVVVCVLSHVFVCKRVFLLYFGHPR